MKKNYIKSSELTKLKETAKKIKAKLGKTYGTSFMSALGYKCVHRGNGLYNVYTRIDKRFIGEMKKEDFALEVLKRGFNPEKLLKSEYEEIDYPIGYVLGHYRVDTRKKYQREIELSRNLNL